MVFGENKDKSSKTRNSFYILVYGIAKPTVLAVMAGASDTLTR
jgi:hypothetical protein